MTTYINLEIITPLWSFYALFTSLVVVLLFQFLKRAQKKSVPPVMEHCSFYGTEGGNNMHIASTMRVNIIGAGVAGLTLAKALKKRNKDMSNTSHKFIINVYERGNTIVPFHGGAGFSLQSGLIILKNLGLNQELMDEFFHPIHIIEQNTSDGQLLASSNITSATKSEECVVAGVRRSKLLEWLARDIRIHFNKELEFCETRGNVAVIKFTDGTVEECEVLIGADGMRSTVRTQIFGYSDPIFSGHSMWYGISRLNIEDDLYNSIQNRMISHVGRGFYTGMHCLGQEGHVMFWKAYHTEKEKMETWGHAELDHAKRKLYYTSDDITEPFPSIVKEAERLMHLGLYYRPPLKNRWHKGRIVLIGDAAHPIPPYLGRNADLAIEDAALLAKLLSDDSLNIEQAFRLLYEKRVSKTDKVLTTSVRMGKYELAKSKIGCFFRNLMYKAAHKTGFTHISIARKYYSATEDIFEYLI
jgi:2-polyprenyl-6-methoxyphenol hydroxylase-like FAD-dependent oxidoreductase